MKVYLVLSQVSYDEGYNVEAIYLEKAKADRKAKYLNKDKKSEFVEYWVEERDIDQ